MIVIIMCFSKCVLMTAFQILSGTEVVSIINRHARKKHNYRGKKLLGISKRI